ncbi:MAG: lecithin retinol acyltransferase family protein [Methylococcaceae bacterium]
MNIGDHLVTHRTGYSHHGIYIGNEQVIHYSGFVNGYSNGEISIASFNEFANGHEIFVKEHSFRRYDGEESVERAFQRLGEDWYNVLLNNCEHFVTWCIEGFHLSSQVNQAIVAIEAAYKLLKCSAGQNPQRQAAQTAASFLADRVVQREASRQVASVIAPRVAQSILSTTAGTTTSAIVIGTASESVLVTSILAAPAAPFIATVAVAAVLGYGVKSAFDWFWEN